MALFSECMLKCARKVLDTADIVREAILRQLSAGFTVENPKYASYGRQYPGRTLRSGQHPKQSRLTIRTVGAQGVSWPGIGNGCRSGGSLRGVRFGER